MPFELRPEMPEEGWQISELEAGGHSDRVDEHLHQVAERDGFPLVIPGFLPKTHLALSLGEMARDHGADVHVSVHRAIFGAYFGEAKDIGSRDVLLEIAKRAGFDADEVSAMWAEDRFGDRLHQFRHVGLNLGLESTPAALICDELHIGSRPYQVIRDAVDRCLLGHDADEHGAEEAGESESAELT